MNLPKRRKHAPMRVKESSLVRSPGHLKWIRGLECAVAGFLNCCGKIHAHHLQSFRAIEGGMGLKVGDDKTIPLCAFHHDAIHHQGQPWFESAYRVNLETTAAGLWKADAYHRLKWERPSTRLSASTQNTSEK